jgi:phosphoribosyl 1,2-cyclic phosphodiesterase
MVLYFDSGLSGREHARRLCQSGLECGPPDAIFLSHEHSDHLRGVGVLARKFDAPVYTSPGTAEAASKRLGRLPELVAMPNGDRVDMGTLSVSSFSVPHDAADPSGYVIQWSGGRLGIATDLGVAGPLVRASLSGCSALLLEFNHDLEMLWNGSYPWPLKQRIASATGHLSNESAAELLSSVAHGGLRVVVLAHLSEENNRADLASDAAREVLKGQAVYAGLQDRPLVSMDLE